MGITWQAAPFSLSSFSLSLLLLPLFNSMSEPVGWSYKAHYFPSGSALSTFMKTAASLQTSQDPWLSTHTSSGTKAVLKVTFPKIATQARTTQTDLYTAPKHEAPRRFSSHLCFTQGRVLRVSSGPLGSDWTSVPEAQPCAGGGLYYPESECKKLSHLHLSGVVVYVTESGSGKVLAILPDSYSSVALQSKQSGFSADGERGRWAQGERRALHPGASAHDAALRLDPSPGESFGHPVVLFYVDFTQPRRNVLIWTAFIWWVSEWTESVQPEIYNHHSKRENRDFRATWVN